MRHSGSDYAKVDKVALRLRMDYNHFDKCLDVFALAKQLNMVLIKYSSLSVDARNQIMEYEETKDGFTIILHKNYEYSFRTFYNDALPSARIRFTIAHEIKHVVFVETHPTEKDEDLADHFARVLLAPTCLVMHYVDSDIAKVIGDFDISYDAAKNAVRSAESRIANNKEELNDYEIEFVNGFISRSK